MHRARDLARALARARAPQRTAARRDVDGAATTALATQKRLVQWRAEDFEVDATTDAPTPRKFEKPKPKSAIRGAAPPGITPTLAKTGPAAGNANTVPEQDESEKHSSQAHLARMMRDGSSFVEHGVGGLDKEFANIFRRVFASRMVDANIARRLK